LRGYLGAVARVFDAFRPFFRVAISANRPSCPASRW